MSRRHHHITTAVVLTLAVAAAAPTAASAQPFGPSSAAVTSEPLILPAVNPQARDNANTNVDTVQAQAARVGHELAARDMQAGSVTSSAAPVRIIKVSQPDDFAWGDAGIGAGATFALIIVLLGSGLYVTHRRTARVTQPR